MERILHLGKFSHWHMGGIETAVDNLLQGLSPFFQLLKMAANNSFRTEIIEQLNYLEVSVPLVGLLARTPFCPTMPYLIKKLQQRYQFSIVHLHLPNPMAHFASEVLPDSVKRIVSWHSDVIHQKHLLRVYQPWINRLLNKASALIVSTAYLAESSRQLAVARRRNIIQVIPYGITLDYFIAYKYKEKINIIRQKFLNRFIVFALGRHVSYKGFYYLIAAMAQLSPNLILLLGGEGPLTQVLKEQAKKLKLEKQVFFLGEVKKEDLPAYYHACDVFCLPSIEKNEAFGIVQLEAMACAKPVISCDLANYTHRVNQDGLTGLVVPPRSPALLAKAIERFYHEPCLCQTLGEAAYAYAKENFTNQLMIDRTRALYEKILSN
ncbi:glycosyltransferase [Rickettsiella endosymbiont of Dermanyssus gallinae]|uniref:glycosyltransferase n=1 Tax=Rickettsiella endosymbiont of Dermanyssus gallinae TaxID=2856608 RepID=UPI001C52F87E|nr:glycosyltransferase [Rickettsiella endosymbiont of Dermanyssus gallinae]